MSLKGRIKKKAKKYGGKVLKIAKKAISMDPMMGGFMSKDDGGDDYRGEAAAKLVKKDTSRQAGGGQINFTTEEWT